MGPRVNARSAALSIAPILLNHTAYAVDMAPSVMIGRNAMCKIVIRLLNRGVFVLHMVPRRNDVRRMDANDRFRSGVFVLHMGLDTL
jgi:hypothetical protein